MKYYVLNKPWKICAKVFFDYADIMIFVLEYFILAHSVYTEMQQRTLWFIEYYC